MSLGFIRASAGGRAIEDKEEWLSVRDNLGLGRVVRGGSFGNLAELVRSADRSWGRPSIVNVYVGIRVARTFTPE